MQNHSVPKDELNGLLNEAIKIALRLTEKHGCHVPFGITITTLGERTDIVADDTETRDVDILFESVCSNIIEGIRGRQFRAVALARNVSFRLRHNETPTPAVQITLDHEQDKACTCYLPYRIANGRVVPGELFATDAVQQFFTK